MNTLKTEAGITHKEQLSKTYIIVFSILYSVTAHSYSKIFNTKINEWVWGIFDLSTCIQLNITRTLVMNTSGKKAQHIYQLSQFTCNIPVCIQLAIAYKIKSINLYFHSQVFIKTLKYSSTHYPSPPQTLASFIAGRSV